MNITAVIFDYLKRHSAATVEGFGTFTLANSRAVVDADSGVILPPAKQVLFAQDYNAADSGFIKFLADDHQKSLQEAREALEVQAGFWKKKIEASEPFDLAPLGAFKLHNEQILFEGARAAKDSPDYYGLEEIKLEDINKDRLLPEKKADYKINKTILYTFLVALPMLGILAAFIWKRDVLFGKKSFGNISVKTSTHRIEKDSLKVKTDSIKADSIHQDSLKSKAIPAAKKRIGKKYKSLK